MSHAEIWDDSALVDSWNEALEEYKHYHSLRARGEKLDDVLRASGSQNRISENLPEDDLANQEEMGKPARPNQQKEIREVPPKGTTTEPQPETKLSQPDPALTAERSEVHNGVGPPPSLQHLVGSVHDEGLKNLLMSWYYAGYYTGLYEGQHQVRQAEAEGR